MHTVTNNKTDKKVAMEKSKAKTSSEISEVGQANGVEWAEVGFRRHTA